MVTRWIRIMVFLFSSSFVFTLDCTKARRALVSSGVDVEGIPPAGFAGHWLDVCRSERTCCTRHVESQLLSLGRQLADDSVSTLIQQVSVQVAALGDSFDAFFRRMMNESRRALDTMFVRTYGVLYEQNSFVFTDLFSQLELYYADGSVDLAVVMQHFFTTLYKHMFMVLHSQNKFDDKYLECVVVHMEQLQPFGDVPTKLTQQLQRSFVATRSLVQALRLAVQLVQQLQHVSVTPECGRAVTRMTQCGSCHALSRVKPCHGLCVQVMTECVAHYQRVQQPWRRFIDGVVNVIDRLEGPFNIESVVTPINIKISDAIMNFQDNGYDVSQKVFDGCGAPRFRRDITKSTSAPHIRHSAVRNRAGRRHGNRHNSAGRHDNHESLSPLQHVLLDLKKELRPLGSFWRELATRLCSDRRLAARQSRIYNCWNGTARAMYKSSSVSGSVAGDDASEMHVHQTSLLYADTTLSGITEQLHTAATLLRDAYNGQTVSWTDSQQGERNDSAASTTSAPEQDDDADDEGREMTSEPGSGLNHHSIITNDDDEEQDPDDTDDDDVWRDSSSDAGSGHHISPSLESSSSSSSDHHVPAVVRQPPSSSPRPAPAPFPPVTPAPQTSVMSLSRAVFALTARAVLTCVGALV